MALGETSALKLKSSGPLWEAAAFAGGVLLYIWWFESIAPYSVVVLLAAMLLSFWKHSETAASVGLGWIMTFSTLRRWWMVWLALAPMVIWLGWRRNFGLNSHTLIYLLWCMLQQLTYQNMISDHLREGLGPCWTARTLSGGAFALVHLPNPVLIPATLIWGTLSSYLFERFRNVIALGILQFLLSSMVFLLTPLAWNHGMRVGPGYFEPR